MGLYVLVLWWWLWKRMVQKRTEKKYIYGFFPEISLRDSVRSDISGIQEKEFPPKSNK